jgi:hypothetical protein
VTCSEGKVYRSRTARSSENEIVPNAREKTRLVAARDDARKQLIERIEKADSIRADDVQSDADLAVAKEKEQRWSKFNSELLSRLFTTDEYASEYDQARRPIHYVRDHYYDVDWEQVKDRLVGSIKCQISALQSVVERLGLIEEGEIRAIDDAAQAQRNLQLLIERFHLVARQMRLRHDARVTLEIGDEYDVQDLLHALLRVFFNDIRKEEWSPSYAGAASRMDFLLPEIETVVEVKRSRPSLTAKQLGEELIIDIEKYQKHPQCRTLVCFVYDPEGSIANPHGIEADLSKQHDKLIVRVMILPR